MKTVGQRIYSRRRELGLTQRQLAEPGVSYAYISRVERGSRNPSVKALRKIAPKLGVSAEWLETGEEGLETKLMAQTARLWRLCERSLDVLDRGDIDLPGALDLYNDLRAELGRVPRDRRSAVPLNS